jgi:alkaline phosphatase
MKNRLLIVTIAFAIVFFTGSDIAGAQPKGKSRPLNIILFIGDGMGTAHLSAGMAVSPEPLVFEYFPYSGFAETSSYNNYITDSGAGGTAMACGVKTRNGMIGMRPDSVAVTSIMELAKKKGLSTGLVSTSSITHATPASFVAHNAGRGNYEDIALDFMNQTIDVFIGGGADHFRKRKDGIDLSAKLKEQGYDVVYTMDDLAKSSSPRLAGLLAPVHMGKAMETRSGMLEKMTEKAIQALSRNKKGFILMVEGSQIDFAGHDGNLQWLVSEVIDLNNAVDAAYKYAQTDGKTLVVVTADHETGGLSLPSGNLQSNSVSGNFGTGDHTGTLVPVFSYGPGAERFSGIKTNTYFFHEFVNLLGLKK